MTTVRLTMAQALVRFLVNQKTEIEGETVPLFPGVFAIFGHGNVTCLSEALEAVKDEFPTWRGQNEQSMALAAIGFAKARKRRQIMVAATDAGRDLLREDRRRREAWLAQVLRNLSKDELETLHAAAPILEALAGSPR